MNRIEIKATVITPVSIGNGTQFSPYKDYFISGGKVHYINEQKLGKLLAEDERFMDEYVEGVANMVGNRSRFDLFRFIHDRLKINPLDIVSTTAFYFGERNNRKLPIQGICKTPNGNCYLPGSSIKGALKTTLLFDYLYKDPKGKIITDQLLRNPNKTEGIEEKLKEFELSVSDSKSFKKEELVCVYDQRLHVRKGHFIIPAYREAIKENSISNFTLEISNNWNDLREAANNYAISGLEVEQNIMIDADKGNEKTETEIYNSLYDFYEEMTDAIRNNQNDIFLRIGFGKGFYMNSVAEVVFKQDGTDGKIEFKKYLKEIGYGKAYDPRVRRMVEYDLDPYLFPITRNINTKAIQPLGWIKLEKMN